MSDRASGSHSSLGPDSPASSPGVEDHPTATGVGEQLQNVAVEVAKSTSLDLFNLAGAPSWLNREYFLLNYPRISFILSNLHRHL